MKELFTDHFNLDSPDWLKYQKPALKKWLGETHACVLIYPCTSTQAFDLLMQAWDEVKTERDHSKAPTCKLRFVFHDNIDIDRSQREVSFAESEEWSRRISARFRPLSSRTGEGTEGFGEDVVKRLLKTS